MKIKINNDRALMGGRTRKDIRYSMYLFYLSRYLSICLNVQHENEEKASSKNTY